MANTTVKVRASTPVIKVKVTSGGLIPTSAPLTLKSTLGANRLDGLIDVDATTEVDGGVLVYQANTDAYVVRQLSLNNLGGFNIDYASANNNTLVSYATDGPDANSYVSKQLVGTTNEVEVTSSITTLTLGLPNNVVIANTLSVAGNTSVGNLSVTGVTNLDGQINVTSAAHFQAVTVFDSGLTSNGAVSINNNLNVGNNATSRQVNVVGTVTTSNLVVTGTTTLANVQLGNTTVAGYINVQSSATINGSVTVNGAVIIANTLSVGNTNTTGYINVSSSANVGGTLKVGGATTLSSTLAAGNTELTGYINVSSSANVGGAVNLRSTLGVNGAVTIANTLSVGNTTITGRANVVGNVVVSDTISGNNLTLTGNLNVSGTTTFLNSTQLNIGDNIITLNADLPAGSNPTESAGIEINRGLQSNVYFEWVEAQDTWSTNAAALAVGNLSVANLHVNGTSTFANSIIAGPNTFVVNATSSYVGIHTGSPSAPLTIGPGGAVLTTPLIQATDNQDSYIQVAIQNLNPGPFASGDFVATADTGDDLSGYIDMGKASSQYNYPDFSFTQPLDGYLLNVDGNLNIVQGSDGEIRLFANGTLMSDKIATFKADAANTLYVLGGITGTTLTGNVDASNVTSGTISNDRLNTATTSGAGIVQLVDAVDNTSITIAATANAVKRAYDLAVSAGANAATAYTNAASYADTKAATAYSNATSYADTKAATAYSNAATYADTKAATAYSNATSYADTKAATAYTNATTYSSNASNISSGTLNTARLPATANVTTAINVGANVNLTTTNINVGNTLNNAAISTTSIRIGNTVTNTVITSTGITSNSFSGNGSLLTSVDAATVGGNTAATLRSYSDTVAATAYSNAASYADTKAATSYSNATSYADTKAATAYSNATTYAATIAGTAYTNAVSYADTKSATAAATAYSNATSYADTKAATAYSNATSYADTKAATAYSNATSYADTKAAAAYSNATAYSSNADNLSSGTVANARLNNATTSGAGIVQLVDDTTNTSITHAATANSVKAAVALAAANAATAYTNAVSYADTKAATAYSNATSYADTKAATAYSNATSYADTKAATAYSNATSYADTKAGQAYTNAASYADTKAATAYSNATSYADTAAATAYTNATTFAANASNISSGTLNTARLPATANVSTAINVGANVNLSTSKISVGNSVNNTAITISGITVGNSVINTVISSTGITANGFTGNGSLLTSVDAATVGGNTAATLRSYSDTVAATAYTNAASYADTKAATAYSNATTFAANADNISSGTLNTARLPATANVTTAINVGANVNLSTSTINVGNATVNSVISSSAVTANTVAVRNSTDYTPVVPSTFASWQEGRMYYDSEEKTIVVHGSGSSNVELTIGQREWVRCRNNTGTTIAKGKPVYVTGVHIPGDPTHGHHPTIALADASDINKYRVIGLTGESIADGQHGYVIVRGYVEGLDTSTLTSGQVVHLGYATPGDLVTTAPTYPNYPYEIGTCLTSNSTVGTLYVNLLSQTFEQFRVTTAAYIQGSLTVDGDFNITGNVNSSAVNNLAVKDNFIYIGAGDTIPSATFTGSGLNDLTFRGVFEGSASTHYYVKIDSVGGTDTFAWSKDNFATTVASGIAITGGMQELDNGISVEFNATTGHTLNDKWDGVAAPVNVDLGWIGNYNDGSYAHTGFFRDASDGVYKVFQGYLPEPDAAVNIDTTDPSFALASIQANTFYGGLSGTANNANNFGGQAPSYYTGLSSSAYTNATAFAANASNISSGTVANARLNSATTSGAGIVQLSDALNSTSITVAATANAVKAAYDLAVTANSGLSTAYSNATSYADTKAATAYSNATSYADTKAAAAYSNATSYADTKAAAAFSNATTYAATIAGTAYTNAVAISANADNITSGTVANARLNSATTSAAGIVQLVDAVNNTSITIAATANSVKRAYDLAVTANTAAGAAYSNATSYADTVAGTAYSNATSYADTKAATAYSNATSYADTKAATAYSNATSYADTKAAAAYSNATTYASNASNLSSGTVANARLNSATTSAAGIVQLVDDVANTSVTHAATANAVKRAYDLAVTANSAAGTAYSNATTYSSNASNLSSGTVANARLNSATTSAAGIVQLNDATDSTSITTAATANSVKAAYDLASTANSGLATAYSNATSYADTKAATAYSNATSYADTKAATAYSNATSYADTKAAAAYSNATSYADTKAATAYTNATSFAANADNISSGTLNTARLPATANVTTAINVGANVTANTTAIKVVNTTITSTQLTLGGNINANGGVGTAGQVLTSGAAGNVYWADATGGSATTAGTNTQVQFNDSGVLGASAGFVFDKAANNLTVANTILVGANVVLNTSSVAVGNTIGNVLITQSTLTVGNSSVGTINTFAINVGANVSLNTTAHYVGNASVNTIITSNSAIMGGDVRVTGNNAVHLGGNTSVSKYYIQYNSASNSIDFVLT